MPWSSPSRWVCVHHFITLSLVCAVGNVCAHWEHSKHMRTEPEVLKLPSLISTVEEFLMSVWALAERLQVFFGLNVAGLLVCSKAAELSPPGVIGMSLLAT